MGVHSHHLHAGSLSRRPRMLRASAAKAVEPVDPLLPFPNVLAALDAGTPLTTGQIIARMGLLATPQLQRRVSRALIDHGYQSMRLSNPDGTGSAIVWQAAPVDPVNARWRQVHEESDRARRPALIDLILAPSASGKFLIALIIGTIAMVAIGWRP